MDSAPNRILASRWLAACGVAAIAAWAAWRASVDLDPGSLWLDDLWVVAFAQSGSWGEFGASPSSAPVGFKLLVAAAVALGGDLEVAAQSIAFCFGIAAIGLVGWLAFRLSTNAAVAVCAAAWVGLDAVFLVEMARVKPYTLDAFVVAGQGLAFAALVEGYSRRRLRCFVAVVLGGLPFSSLSVFPALAATAVAGVVLWRGGVRDVHALAAGVVILGAIGAAAAFFGAALGADELRGYWDRQYLSSRDAASFLGGASRWLGSWGDRLMHGSKIHAGPLPLPGGVALLLALAGALQLWLAGCRAHLWVGALLCLGVALASVAQVLPLGVQRVETFLLPFAAVLIGSAAGLAARLEDRRAVIAASALLPLLAAIQLPSSRVAHYPVQQARPVVEALTRAYRAGDGVWSNMLGTFALAVYGPWPVDFERNDRLGIPHAVPRLAAFALLDGTADASVGGAPDTNRVLAFVCNAGVELLDQATRQLVAAGYHAQGRVSAKRCQFARFDR